MKQTAVEWFMDKIGEKQRNGFYVIDTLQDVQNVFEQAKEMEKQQMIEMHDKGFDSVVQLNDDYAIEFAEWCIKKRIDFFDSTEIGETYTIDGNVSKYKINELLEIYKKEEGL
jgi:hypothetical protein